MMLALAIPGLFFDPLPPLRREFRAAWVATVDNIDWPSKRTLSTPQQQAELTAIFDRANEIGLNAIIFQVRPSADALYESPLEPWSEYLTNRQGRGPIPKWDPLAFAVKLAHDRAMELHVWMNPYRAFHPAQKGPISSDHIAKTRPELVKSYGKYLWMDPGEPDVQKRILAVTRDIVRRYDIDGIHIDDYFYPYPEKGQPFPDELSFRAYQARGGTLARDDWRRKNVDDTVRGMYEAIKAERVTVKFGISPFGIYRPGIPSGIKAGVDQYSELFADAQKWLREGWCDYFSPQLYWPIAQTAQSFPRLLAYWQSQNLRSRHLWPGLFTSRVMPAEGNWRPAEIINQVKLIRDAGGDGEVHFSMKALQKDANGVADLLRGSAYGNVAFVPESPWISDASPSTPELSVQENRVTWKISRGKQPFAWGFYRRYGRKWLVNRCPAIQTAFELDATAKPDEVALVAVNRAGKASAAARITIK
jgi:uncharacterized lipoprotein YddW (UPF0748 family)